MLKRFCYFCLAISLLTGCARATPTATPTLDLTSVYRQTLGTAEARLTQTAAVPTVTPTLSPWQLPFFSFTGYHVIFAQGGSLFFQSDESAPVLLTQAKGSDLFQTRQLSADRQKIIFLRGKTSKTDISNTDLYSVNANGTGELLLTTPKWLTTQAKGTGLANRLPIFVPGTHQVLFETSLCQSTAKDAPCSIGIFLADADSGEIKPVVPPGKQVRYALSPDGKMIALSRLGQVDLIDLNGKVLQEGIFRYTASQPDAIFAALTWLPDSSGLIAALPTNTFLITAYGKYVTAYAFWRYTLSDSRAESIPLDPSPMNLQGDADRFVISPDGLWLLYGGNGPTNSDLYLANLRDGRLQRIGDNPQPYYSWSPDSQRFFGENFAGVLGPRVAQMSKKTFSVLRWIDATHFVCQYCGENNSAPHIAEIKDDVLRFYRIPLNMVDDGYLVVVKK